MKLSDEMRQRCFELKSSITDNILNNDVIRQKLIKEINIYLPKVKELEEQLEKMKNCTFDLQISQNPCCNCKFRKEWKMK